MKRHAPIEDHHVVQSWGSGWGIAVASDGAGSRDKSATGSRLIAQEYAHAFFKQHLLGHIKKNIPVALGEWEQIAYRGFLESIYALNQYAEEQGHDVQDYGCTIIVMVYSPFGLLCAHIGDGRACYRDESGAWHACMKPYNPDPENASMTVFITSNIWEESQATREYIECQIVEGATAFALLTDGVESYCFTCTPRDYTTGDDPNTPSPLFFEPMYQSCIAAQLNEQTIQQDMAAYLSTAPRIADEVDDKTLIFGYLRHEASA